MALELIYTSAEKGLKRGAHGFCTVAMTVGIPPGLVERLESMSDYRAVYPLGDARAASNPIQYAFGPLSIGSRSFQVLSRISDCPSDYSGRTNKLAQHLVLDPGEIPAAGAAWLAQQEGLFLSGWSGSPHWMATPKMISCPARLPRPAQAWAGLGDAGWAAVLARHTLLHPTVPAILVYAPEKPLDLLALFDEALALLPAYKRGEISFCTYCYTPRSDWLWRGVVADSDEHRQGQRLRGALVLDLSRGPLDRAEPNALTPYAIQGGEPDPDIYRELTKVVSAPDMPRDQVEGTQEADAYEEVVYPPPNAGEPIKPATRPAAKVYPLPRRTADSHKTLHVVYIVLLLLVMCGSFYLGQYSGRTQPNERLLNPRTISAPTPTPGESATDSRPIGPALVRNSLVCTPTPETKVEPTPMLVPTAEPVLQPEPTPMPRRTAKSLPPAVPTPSATALPKPLEQTIKLYDRRPVPIGSLVPETELELVDPSGKPISGYEIRRVKGGFDVAVEGKSRLIQKPPSFLRIVLDASRGELRLHKKDAGQFDTFGKDVRQELSIWLKNGDTVIATVRIDKTPLLPPSNPDLDRIRKLTSDRSAQKAEMEQKMSPYKKDFLDISTDRARRITELDADLKTVGGGKDGDKRREDLTKQIKETRDEYQSTKVHIEAMDEAVKKLKDLGDGLYEQLVLTAQLGSAVRDAEMQLQDAEGEDERQTLESELKKRRDSQGAEREKLLGLEVQYNQFVEQVKELLAIHQAIKNLKADRDKATDPKEKDRINGEIQKQRKNRENLEIEIMKK